MSVRRVLLVDDEDMVRLSLRDMLEVAGYEIAGEARDGCEAISQACALRPDVILMDISMPQKDGVQAAAEIMEANPMPIVFLTAFSDPENVARAGEAGALAYLVKPCRQADLSPAIELAITRFAEGRRQHRDLESVRWAMETVRRLSREVASNPDIEGVVALALRCVTSALKVPAAALMLIHGDQLRVRTALGLDPKQVSAFRVPVGESIFGMAAALSQPGSFALGNDESALGPWASAAHPFGKCGSALVVPLPSPDAVGERKAMGCLGVLRAEVEPFTPAETAILSTLADELVVAFQAAQARHALAWRLWRHG